MRENSQRWKNQGRLLGKLVYLFEGKEEVREERRRQLPPFYFGRLCAGSDRMCKLRCFIRKHGRDKKLELVNYRREKEQKPEEGTGTDGMISSALRKKYTTAQKETQRYAEQLHVTISNYTAVRKILAIRQQIGDI